MFATWLSSQTGRSDAVGQLARLAADSGRFPRPPAWRLYAFLHWAGQDRRLRALVKTSHAEWRKTRGEAK